MSEMFRTVYDRSRVRSATGSPMANDYDFIVTKDGKKRLAVVGEHNLQNEIDAYRSSCDLNIIIDRYLNIGDPQILNKRQTFYADIGDFPTTYAEVLKFNIESEKQFKSLTKEQRLAFDNSLEAFINSYGSPEFFEKLGYVKDTPVEDPVVKESAE